jgi:DNA-binding MltR family transcriptional regulator
VVCEVKYFCMSDKNLKPKPFIVKKESPLFWHKEHLEQIMAELDNETDRGVALFSASILDQVLQEILAAFFVNTSTSKELFRYPQPLSSFSARQNLCLALGLISKQEYQECDTIRKIRNEFAHASSYSMSFENEKISNLCKSLQAFRLKYDERVKFDLIISINRLAFMFSVTVLHTDWTARIKFAKDHKRLPFKEEPQ